MHHGTFYLLEDDTPIAWMPLACRLSALFFEQRRPVKVWCTDVAQAEALDEALWTFEPKRFIPHALMGEVGCEQSPIELLWTSPPLAGDVLINLAPQLPSSVASFKEIIDFVPADDKLKLLARARYKQLRQLGYQLRTCSANEGHFTAN